MKKLSVLVPVLNEDGSINELVQRIDRNLRASKIVYEIIFVDDHSKDDTVKIIKKLQRKYPIHLHTKKGKPGKAYSILEGIPLCKYDYIAMIDGDLQYPPEALSGMFALTKKHGVVVANRKVYAAPRLRRIGSKISFLFFEKFLHGFECDTQSGLKIFKKELAQQLSTTEVTKWTIDMPLLKIAQDFGESIGSYDIEFTDRQSGVSKVSFLRAGTEIALASVKLRLIKRRVYSIEPTTKKNSIGAGYNFKGKKYITHTSLPHDMTALDTFYPWQKVVMGFSLFILLIGAVLSAKTTFIVIIGILTFIYFLDFVFSLYVLVKSLRFPQEISITDKEINAIDESKLPIYSILCPLYKEARILSHFVDAMKSIDWPRNKLDILLLLEEDDVETIQLAKKLKLPKYFRILVVPHSFPKTKPKACNYGFNHSKGEYVVIYDAEDKPDPLQLKKSYLGFLKSGDKMACLQSKLNYFNTDFSVLTRLFTAEYSLWFDLVLPGLQSVSGPLPLGGTSNHFRSNVLKELHAWDPFNVTEDCDLGVRIFKEGYKTAIIDSTTLEEANSSFKGWLKQRSRWIKGYMQTYLVHIRNPLEFVKGHGSKAFIFHLVIGMRMVFILINPILWVFTLSYFIFYPIVGPTIESLYPAIIFYPAVTLLVFGNFVHFYNYMIGCAKRGHYSVIKFVFLVPFYWIMTSWAAGIAFYQLFTKPHYWEKTTHGLHLDTKLNIRSILANKLSSITATVPNVKKGIPALTPTVTGGFMLIVSNVIANGINFIYSIYLGRSISLEQFGTVSFISSVLSISAIVIHAVAKSVTVQTSKYLGKNNTLNRYFWDRIYQKSYWIAAVITLLWVFSSSALARFFNIESVIPLLLFSPSWIFFTLTSINHGYILSNLRFKSVAGITLIESIVKLVAAHLFVSTNNSAYVYLGLTLSIFVSFIISDQIVRKTKDSIVRVREVFPKKFFYTSMLANISVVAFLSLDVVIAKRFLSPTEAGEYALISLIGKMIYLTGSLFAQFVTPIISREQGEKNNSRALIAKLVGATAAVSTAAYSAVGLFGEYTIPFIFGERAETIVEFLPFYGIAIVGFTLSAIVINYHQIKDRYIFPIVGFIFTLVQVGVLSFYNSNLHEFVTAFIVVTLAQTLCIFLLHIFRTQVYAVSSNVNDLFDLIFDKQRKSKESKKSLRILVLNWRDTKHSWAGGAEVYVHEISKRWVSEGHTVTVFCGNDGKNPRNEKIDGVQMVRRGGFYTVYFWAALYYVLRFRNVFDVIVDCENGIPFFTPLYTRTPKILLIYHVHKDVHKKHLKFPFSYIAMFLESKVMPFLYKTSRIMTISESSQKDISLMGFDLSRDIQIVYPGIDPSKYIRSKKTKSPSFVYLGRLQHYKNIDIAIKAFARVLTTYKDATLTIAGFGESENQLKRLCQDLGVEKSVKFLGYISDNKRKNILARSWVSIQPSSFEGWGITVIEANASGTPVIASKVKGLVDSVVDGKTGVLVPVKNVSRLTRAMGEMISNTSKRTSMAKEAYKWSKNFDWEKSSQLFLSVLADEINHKTKAAVDQDFVLVKIDL